MKTKSLAWLAGLGVGLGIAACSFISCSEPPTECQVGLNSPYVAMFTPQGALPECAATQPALLQPGDTIGMEFYNPPAAGSTASDGGPLNVSALGDGGLALGTYSTTTVTMAAVSDTMANLEIEYSDQMYPDGTPSAPDPVFFNDNVSGDAPYAAGGFESQFPDGNNFCYVPTLQPAQEVFSYMDGGAVTPAGTPLLPQTTFGESWSNLKVYVTAAVQGDQFNATLTRTVNSCSVTYNVVGMWPAIPCTGADPNNGSDVPAIGFCSPCADPDAGMAIGSGINPNFPIACVPLYNVNDTFGRGGACMNLQTDASNCGACGNVCPALETCTAGACAPIQGATLCTPPGGTGTYTNLSNDPANCGTCNTACATGQVCSAGACTSACGTGLTTCMNAATMTTTCSNVQTDVLNCGACGNVCTNGSSCAAGVCTCATGETLCGGSLCTNVMTDATNCGTCGTACAAGQTCSGGTCSIIAACPTGTAQCGGSPYYCMLTGQGTATGSSTLPQLNSGEPACANASNEN